MSFSAVFFCSDDTSVFVVAYGVPREGWPVTGGGGVGGSGGDVFARGGDGG